MTDALRYPSLRCVLEYMEANKRIYLASRCPSISQAEKSIPLRIDYLEFQEDYFKINKHSYSMKDSEESYKANERKIKSQMLADELTPGDRVIGTACGPDIRYYVELEIENENGFLEHRRLPKYLETHEAAKKLTTLWFAGRKCIRVKDLVFEFEDVFVLRLPENFQVSTKNLSVRGVHFEDFLPLVTPSKSLFGELKVEVLDPENFKCPILRKTKKLVIVTSWDEDQPEWILELQKLSNLEVQLKEYDIQEEEVLGIVRYWKKNGNKIGTCWTLKHWDKQEMAKTMEKLKAAFGGEYKFLDKQTQGKVGPLAIPYCVCIPFNKSSNLNIFGTKDLKNRTFHVQLKIEKIPSKIESLSLHDQIRHTWNIINFNFLYFSISVIALPFLTLLSFYIFAVLLDTPILAAPFGILAFVSNFAVFWLVFRAPLAPGYQEVWTED